MEGNSLLSINGGITVATSGELQAIVEELALVDIGDAASYLGEEGQTEEEELDMSVSADIDEAELM
jgi:hypothetical protein